MSLTSLSDAARNMNSTSNGDLDAPAGVELGIYGSLLGKEYFQKNVVEFVASLLASEADRVFLNNLDKKQAKEVRNGLTMEITPETAEDSYGRWWVSVYSEPTLENARATDAEL